MKKLVEAAEKWVFDTNSHKWSNNDNTAGDNFGSFIAGAKWQKETNFRYIILDDDTYDVFLTNELTEDIEGMIKQGLYRVIDLHTMESINSNRDNLFRKEITEY